MGDTLPTEAYWRRRFQEAAEKHQLDADISMQTKYSLERRIASFLRVFVRAVSSPSKVLDLGCGPGTYTRLLTRQGHKVIGVDYTMEVIARAVEKSKELGIAYVVADARALPFTQGSFDAVVCIGLFQHLSPRSVFSVIAEIKRALSPDVGLLFLMTLNRLSMKAFFDKFVDHLRLLFGAKPTSISQEKRQMQRYSPHRLIRLLKENGFKQSETHGVFIFPKNPFFLDFLLDRAGKPAHFVLPTDHSFLIKAGLANRT